MTRSVNESDNVSAFTEPPKAILPMRFSVVSSQQMLIENIDIMRNFNTASNTEEED
jgi:hypothetical protein